jgi:hypothetical protein
MMLCIEWCVYVLEFASSAAAMFERPNGWVRSTTGSTLFPRGGCSRGAHVCGAKAVRWLAFPVPEVLDVDAQTD